jgi:hypothetical protein
MMEQGDRRQALRSMLDTSDVVLMTLVRTQQRAWALYAPAPHGAAFACRASAARGYFSQWLSSHPTACACCQ